MVMVMVMVSILLNNLAILDINAVNRNRLGTG